MVRHGETGIDLSCPAGEYEDPASGVPGWIMRRPHPQGLVAHALSLLWGDGEKGGAHGTILEWLFCMRAGCLVQEIRLPSPISTSLPPSILPCPTSSSHFTSFLTACHGEGNNRPVASYLCSYASNIQFCMYPGISILANERGNKMGESIVACWVAGMAPAACLPVVYFWLLRIPD